MIKRPMLMVLVIAGPASLLACTESRFGGGRSPQIQQSTPAPVQPVATSSPTATPAIDKDDDTDASNPSTGSTTPLDPVTPEPTTEPSTPSTQPIPTEQPTVAPVEIPDTSAASEGVAHVPVTAFINMEHGYHGLEEDTIFQLRDNAGVVAAGWATIDAARNGRPTDGSGAYPGILLRLDLSYVRANGERSAAAGNGTINICHSSDANLNPEQATCAAKQGPFGSDGERPVAIVGAPASWTVSESNGKPEYNVRGQFNLSVFHPVWNFAAPGKGFKDYQSPLVFDLDANGAVDLVDVWDDRVPVRFDLMGEGKVTRTGWVARQDGFLALDLNANGVIDDGLELFGEYTAGGKAVPKGQKSWDNGFQALAQHDANSDAVIDARDPVFSRLRIWQDRNQDGKSQPNELKPLAKHHIVAIDLGYHRTGHTSFDIVANNEVRLVSTYRTQDGKTRTVADVWFKQRRYSDGASAAHHATAAHEGKGR